MAPRAFAPTFGNESSKSVLSAPAAFFFTLSSVVPWQHTLRILEMEVVMLR